MHECIIFFGGKAAYRGGAIYKGTLNGALLGLASALLTKTKVEVSY